MRAELRVPLTWIAAGVMLAAWMTAISAGVDPWTPDPIDTIAIGAGYGPRTLDGQPWRVVTGALVHLGGLLLVINLVVLVALGPALERACGRAATAVILLGATAIAGAASVAWAPYAITAGASGMVAGLCGALAVVLARERPVRRVVAGGVLAVVAWGALLPLWADGVDHAAHAAGLVAGAALAALVLPPRRRALRGLAALAGSVGLVAVILAVTPPPVDLRGAARRIVELEAHFNRRIDGAGRRPDRPMLARTIEAEVIAPLRAVAATLRVDDRMPPRDRDRARALTGYLEARLRALALFVEYLDTGDPALEARINAATAEAEAFR